MKSFIGKKKITFEGDVKQQQQRAVAGGAGDDNQSHTAPAAAAVSRRVAAGPPTSSAATASIRASKEAFMKTTARYELDAVAFSFMSTEDIKRMSVVKCYSPKYEGMYSMNSPLMCSMDRDTPCDTCGLTELECMGHMGYIELAVPLPHPLAVDVIPLVMQSVCINCGRVLLPKPLREQPNIRRLKGVRRLQAVAEMTISAGAIVVCPRNMDITEANRKAAAGRPHDESLVGQPLCEDDNTFRYSIPKPGSTWRVIARRPKTGEEIFFGMEQVEQIFMSMTRADVEFLGFGGESHPRNLVIRALPVIPESNRPPIKRDGEKKHDHITTTYSLIIQMNQALKAIIPQTEAGGAIGRDLEYRLVDLTGKLNFYVFHLMTNRDNEYKIHREKAAFTISDRMAGKEGFCRATAQGKRVDNSARSVIGPGVMPFGSVVVPYSFRLLTLPETVNFANYERLRRAAAEGEVIHITRSSGKFSGIRMFYIRLLEMATERRRRLAEGEGTAADLEKLRELENDPPEAFSYGDVVERLGGRGDDLIINRQPTLHRHSLIGTRAIYSSGKTIRLHMSYTTPANADFDGDEMNIYMPQTLRARAEVRHLLSADRQIISAANCKPSMGLVFNCPIAAYLLTKDAAEDDLLPAGPPRLFKNVADYGAFVSTLLDDLSRAKTIHARAARHGVDMYSAKGVLSLAFPEDFFYTRKAEDEGAKDTLIVDGIFVRGVLTKKDTANVMIHSLFMRYGHAVTARFIREAHFILDWYIERRGYSLGLADCLLSDPAGAKEQVVEEIDRIRAKVSSLESISAKTDTEALFREIEVASVLRSIMNVGKKLGNTQIAGGRNPLGEAISSGAKGGPSNIAQIAGALGEQFVYGDRPHKDINYDRSLPYFLEGDASIEARGFVTHSFAEGMTPAEFFFHMEWSRTGLMDTSLRTADTGWLNHRIGKILENDKLAYSGGVTNSAGIYSSLSYGEGYDPEELALVGGFVSVGAKYMPFDLRSLEKELSFGAAPATLKPLTKKDIEAIAGAIPSVMATTKAVARHNRSEIVAVAEKQLAEIAIPRDKLPQLLHRIVDRCRRAESHPGDTVGLHAAEAIGQPISQATLNTFHQTGGSSADIGLNTFNEVINLSKERKNPTVSVHLKQPITLTETYRLEKAFRLYQVSELIDHVEFGIHDGVETLPIEVRRRRRTAVDGEDDNSDIDLTGRPLIKLFLDPYLLFVARITTTMIANAIEEAGGVFCVPWPTIEGIVDIYPTDEVVGMTKAKAAKKFSKIMDHFTKDVSDAAMDAFEKSSGILFLQMFIYPAVTKGVITVASSFMSSALNRGHVVVPVKSRSLALCRKVEPVVVNVSSFIRGTTGANKTTVWVDAVSANASGVSMERIASFITATGGGGIVSINADHIITSSAYSLDAAKAAVKQANEQWDKAVAAVRKENPEAPDPPLPAAKAADEYVYIKGGVSQRVNRTGVLCRVLVHPAVNGKYTTTNNLHEIFAVRGLEATRAAVARELYELIMAIGSTINPRHIAIVADVMTMTGTLMPFTARGSSRRQNLGAFSESSFEQAVKAFKQSAISGATESVSATSAAILLGAQCSFGTGMCSVIPKERINELFSGKVKRPIPPKSAMTTAEGASAVAPAETKNAAFTSASEATGDLSVCPAVLPPPGGFGFGSTANALPFVKGLGSLIGEPAVGAAMTANDPSFARAAVTFASAEELLKEV